MNYNGFLLKRDVPSNSKNSCTRPLMERYRNISVKSLVELTLYITIHWEPLHLMSLYHVPSLRHLNRASAIEGQLLGTVSLRKLSRQKICGYLVTASLKYSIYFLLIFLYICTCEFAYWLYMLRTYIYRYSLFDCRYKWGRGVIFIF